MEKQSGLVAKDPRAWGDQLLPKVWPLGSRKTCRYVDCQWNKKESWREEIIWLRSPFVTCQYPEGFRWLTSLTSTVARRDKTLPRFEKHVPESKTHPRIWNTSQNPKHVPESKNNSRNPKHVPEFKNTFQNPDSGTCFGFWEMFLLVW